MRETQKSLRLRGLLGKIDKLTYNLGPEQMSAEDKAAAAEMLARAHD